MIQGKKYVGDSYEQGPLKIQCNHSGAHVLILCAQILWVTQKVIQLLLIKSPFLLLCNRQLETRHNIPVSLIEKESLACQKMQTQMQCARSEQLYVSHFS